MTAINLVYKYCANCVCSKPKFDEMGATELEFAGAIEDATQKQKTEALADVVVAHSTPFACRSDKNWGKS